MSEYIVEVNDHPTIKQEGWNFRCDDLFIQHEKIVRCRDCRHYVDDPQPIDPGWPMMCDESGRDMVPPYGFCAWGKRRGDAE